MIECKVINGRTQTSCKGSFEEIVGDTGRILISIYQSLAEADEDEDAADTFVKAMHAATNPLVFYKLKKAYLESSVCMLKNYSEPVEEDTNV